MSIYLFEERKHDASPICNCCSSEAFVVLSFVKEASKKETLISLCEDCFKKAYEIVNVKMKQYKL